MMTSEMQIPMYFKNIQEISWNFTASGHGKGPMDGVGGTVKRKADSLVLHGHDIRLKRLLIRFRQSCIKIWEVTSEEIQKCKLDMPEGASAVPQIMALHQITWSKEKPTVTFLREISCFSCPLGGKCSHFSLKIPMVTLLPEKKSNEEKRKKVEEESMSRLSPDSELVEFKKKINVISEVLIVPPQEPMVSLLPEKRSSLPMTKSFPNGNPKTRKGNLLHVVESIDRLSPWTRSLFSFVPENPSVVSLLPESILVNENSLFCQGVKKTITDWDSAVATLKDAYSRNLPPNRVFREIFSRMQQLKETTEGFVCHMRALITKLLYELPEIEQLDMVYALFQRKIRKRLPRGNFHSFKELLSQAHDVEQSMQSTLLVCEKKNRSTSPKSKLKI
ncbi:hypothetical protein NQ314_017992 [Rhamnusium bicolor]|uniref:Retrotransposon gag domain-containing protein n=1 Tax=Rhamnusium bicolor TaxID=1586634 RepID=A0AAV8WSV6_9CUCU|nr:hypothetical protein NQ314_017992 [Rhamnusium bicolor]